MGRLQDLLVPPPQRPAVVVQASPRRMRRGVWNVQVFHGLGAKPPPLARLTRLAPRVRFEQVNAYGPRAVDALERRLPGAEVSRFGHPALNELEGLGHDPEGPVAWLPAVRGRALAQAAAAAVALAREVPVLAALPRAAPSGLRRRLAAAHGVTLAPAGADRYPLLHGARAVLADGGNGGCLGVEAYCAGLPVALLAPEPIGPAPGLGAELAARVPRFWAGDPVREWAWHPDPASDTAWARDLLFEPARRRNDLFAGQLRAVAAEVAG
ncbi:MAG: hypothetical protein QOD77_497 [Thermoplasmata archaeon]|jgi:hypothetical protein|nr:hypothetical protein [Thermoplasmata archaeon]